jgi:hypothetical protein
MLWEPPRYIYSLGSPRHPLPYGLHHRYYASMRGLGQSNCADASGNAVSCIDPNCAQGDCGTPLPGSLPAPPAQPAAGVPTGAIVLYQGTWDVSLVDALNANAMVSAVSQAIQNFGLQVVAHQSDGSSFTVGSYNVQLTIQVTGAGFARPQDIGSIVDHAFWVNTGGHGGNQRMPETSSTMLQSLPQQAGIPGFPTTTGVPSNLPPSTGWSLSNIFGGGTTPPPGQQSMAQWFQQNATTFALLALAIVVLPPLIKKI